MRLELHAVDGPPKLLCVWDTGLKRYRTEPMRPERMRQVLASLANSAGILSGCTAYQDAVSDLIARAVPVSMWRDGGICTATSLDNLAVHDRLAAEFGAQMAEAMFDRRIEELLAPLDAEARTLLTRTFAMNELMRGSGRATLRPRDGANPKRTGYRDRAHALAIAERLRLACPWLTVNTNGTDQEGPCTIVFSVL